MTPRPALGPSAGLVYPSRAQLVLLLLYPRSYGCLTLPSRRRSVGKQVLAGTCFPEGREEEG